MKKHIRLVLVAIIFFMGTITMNTNMKAEMISAAQTETNSDFTEQHKVELPSGVEILQTVSTDNEIFAVGMSKATEGDFAFGGTDDMRSIFIAKYSKDLKLQKVVNANYKIGYYSKEQDFCRRGVCDEKNPNKTQTAETDMKRYLLEIKNGSLFVIGQASENEEMGASCGYSCTFQRHFRNLFVSKYNLDLSLVKTQKFGVEVTELAKKSSDMKSYNALFTSTKYVITDSGIYARYNLLVHRVGRESGIIKIDFDNFQVQKAYVGTSVDKLNFEDEIHDFAQYKDGIAILTSSTWKFYDANLQFKSEISHLDKAPRDVKMSREVIQGDSFFTNSGTFLKIDTQFSDSTEDIAQEVCSDYICLTSEKTLIYEKTAQTEQGQLISVNTQGGKVYLSTLNDKGEKQGVGTLIGSKKQEKLNFNVESYKETVVVVAQNIFAVYNYSSTATAHDGQMQNDCVKAANFSRNTIGYKDPKSGVCYTAQKTFTTDEAKYGEVTSTTAKIYKDGKELSDVKQSSLGDVSKNGPLNTLNINFVKMITDNNGHLYVIGDVSNYYVTGKANAYALSLNIEDGKVLGVYQKHFEHTTAGMSVTDFTNLNTIGKDEFVVTGVSYDVTGQNGFPNKGDVTHPCAIIFNEKMEVKQDLFKTEGAKYTNRSIEQFESINETYYKMSIVSSKKEVDRRVVLYDKKNQKFVTEINQDAITSAKIDDHIINIENGKIVEKDSSGNVVKQQKVDVENAQVAPKKINDKYIVAAKDKNQKLKFYLIGDNGKSEREIATDIIVKEAEAIIFDASYTLKDFIVRFNTVSKDGTAKKHSFNLEKLNNASENKNDINLLLVVVAVVVIGAGVAGLVIYLVIKKQKGKGKKNEPENNGTYQAVHPEYQQEPYQQEPYQQQTYQQYEQQPQQDYPNYENQQQYQEYNQQEQ